MRALLQRVSSARVCVEGDPIGAIDHGLLVFLALEPADDERTAARLLDRVLAYRVFPDEAGRMNRAVGAVAGGVLLVSQFTLAADTSRGLRPSFSSALAPGPAAILFDRCCELLRERHAPVAFGRFGADMQVHLVNDGPVTFLLEQQAA